MEKTPILPLLAVNFVGTLGFSIVVPFLVILVTKWGGNAVIYGVLAATYSAFQLVGAPILGRLSDRIGRRRVLLLSQAGTLLSWCVFLVAFALPGDALLRVDHGPLGAFTLTLPLLVLFIARAADGLTGGNVSVANAYLADITPEAERGPRFGQMALSSNIGFVVGPMLAGLLGATVLGEIVPVAAALGISVVALVLIFVGLRDVVPKSIPSRLEEPNACAVYGQENRQVYELDCARPDGILGVLRLPGMLALMAINFLVMLGFSFFYAAFPVNAVTAMGWDAVQIGFFFAVLSLFMVVVQGPVLAFASPRVSERWLMAGGGAVLALGFVALWSGDTRIVYIAAGLIALGNGLMWPTFMAALSKAAGERLQGAVQGYAGSIGAVASIAGLVGGGIALVKLGAWVFPVAAAVIGLAAVAALFAGGAHQKAVKER